MSFQLVTCFYMERNNGLKLVKTLRENNCWNSTKKGVGRTSVNVVLFLLLLWAGICSHARFYQFFVSQLNNDFNPVLNKFLEIVYVFKKATILFSNHLKYLKMTQRDPHRILWSTTKRNTDRYFFSTIWGTKEEWVNKILRKPCN